MPLSATRSFRESGTARFGPADFASLYSLLEDLYRQHLATDPDNLYLAQHSAPRSIANQVRTFQWYQPYLPESGAILEWGCQHAPDSCLLRCACGDRFSLHACDFNPTGFYGSFCDYAGLSYSSLTDIVTLPYAPNSFQAVIASGVLEHAAMDYESLKEIHRILAPDGVVIISYLPNWLSINEWVRRVIRKKCYHRRLYGMRETSQLLKRAGFYPVAGGHHTFWRERILGARGGRFLARTTSGLFPQDWFCSTLCFVARKVTCM